MKQSLWILGLLSLLISCADFSSERKEVAAMQSQVQDEVARLERLDPASLPMSTFDIDARLNTVKKNYADRKTLIGKELGIMLADFKVYKKVFKKLPQKRLKLKEELELCEKQLASLDKDLAAAVLSDKDAQKYVQDERSALNGITASMDQLDSLFARGSRGYIKMLPKIDSLINQLPAVPSE